MKVIDYKTNTEHRGEMWLSTKRRTHGTPPLEIALKTQSERIELVSIELTKAETDHLLNYLAGKML